MQNNSCRQLFSFLFQMLKWRTKQEQSQTCLSYALQGGIRRSQMTEQREQNPSLLEFCRIATIRQSQMVGQRDNGTKGHLCFRFFNSDKNGLLKLLYILLIYINNIYNNFNRPFLSELKNRKHKCPFVPLSLCPTIWLCRIVAIRQNSSKLGFCSRCSVIWLRRIPPCKA